MRPTPLNTRSDLIAALTDRGPSRACNRYIRAGKVRILGGFTPAGELPRWIVEVTSPHGRSWFVALVADDEAQTFRVEYPQSVAWADWAGNPDSINGSVYDGDDPTTFDTYRRDRHVWTPQAPV